ncbi:MAG: uncharacterized protein JWM98_2741 [Thermoleophilia bacterium]|nr:uncharacterized protein [Thermoleophilia bacterium]
MPVPFPPLRFLRASAALACVLATACALGAPGSSEGASSSVNVLLDVMSSTTLGAGGCASGSAATAFGSVLPGTFATTPGTCAVLFGSSNDTSALRLTQTDGVGTGMFRMTDGTTRDTGFGPAGIRTSSISAGSDQTIAGAVQRDGMILTIGAANLGASNVYVARTRADGTFDPAFNGGSPRIIDLGSSNDFGMDVAVARDGTIAIGGYYGTGAAQNGWVSKLTATGADDPAFGGVKTIDFAGQQDTIEALELDSQGRIVLAGGASVAGVSTFGVARYLPNGTPDTSFNGSGKRTIAFGGYAFAADVAIRPNDGIAMSGATDSAFGLVVLDSTGADDPTFVGTATGRQKVAVSGDTDLAQGLAVQPDGKIVLAGSSQLGTNERVGVVRINATGGVDTTFGGGAQRLSFSSGNEYAEGVLVQPDGRVVLSGGANSYTDTGVLRLTSAGALDPDFDTDGRMAVNAGANDGVGRPLLGPDGRLVLVGSDSEPVVIVLLGTQYADYAGTWAAAGSRFGACLETLSAGVPTWSVAGAGNCTTAVTANWKGIATSSAGPSALVASTTSGTATASLRFGAQVALAQTRGSYVAPLEFEVLAPG